MLQERRVCAREPLSLSISLPGGHRALTRDVSPRGLYFLVPPAVQLDPWLYLSYELPYAGLKYIAAAEVVRVDDGPRFRGVAVRLHDAHLLPVDD